MNNMKDVRKALIRTMDGKSVLFWWLVFTAFLVRSIASSGLALDQLKYLFFSLIAFALFCKFRVISFQPEEKTNLWGLINVNGFCLFLTYLECFKAVNLSEFSNKG